MRQPLRAVGSAMFVAVLLVATAACTDPEEPPGRSPAAERSDATSGPSGTTARPEWVQHRAPEDCMCADGSEFTYFSRTDDPQRVVIYFQGGGACFSAETCRFEDGTYKVTAGAADNPEGGSGIFDFDDPRNPFTGWSMVFVPYCTGDVHIGDATTTYDQDLTVEHNGFQNARTALDFLVEEYPDVSELFVTGSSAGGVPTPLFGGMLADELPNADIAVLADASGGYTSRPAVNAAIGELWGVHDNLPPWPVIADRPTGTIGIPDLFWIAGTHARQIRMARYDNAHDEVQRSFSALSGAGDRELPTALDQNEELVEANGVDLSVYVAPGEDHTILGQPDLYDLSVDGAPFLDWLTTLVDGGVPGDVRCVDCDDPPGPR